MTKPILCTNHWGNFVTVHTKRGWMYVRLDGGTGSWFATEDEAIKAANA